MGGSPDEGWSRNPDPSSTQVCTTTTRLCCGNKDLCTRHACEICGPQHPACKEDARGSGSSLFADSGQYADALDEPHNLHLGTAFGTLEGINLIDALDERRPRYRTPAFAGACFSWYALSGSRPDSSTAWVLRARIPRHLFE